MHRVVVSTPELVAVLRENIQTGVIGSRVHALRLDDGSRATLCGQSIFDTGSAAVQYSVEPEGTVINCPHCKEKLHGTGAEEALAE